MVPAFLLSTSNGEGCMSQGLSVWVIWIEVSDQKLIIGFLNRNSKYLRSLICFYRFRRQTPPFHYVLVSCTLPPLNGNLCFSSFESETCLAAQTSPFVALSLTILSGLRGSLLQHPSSPHLSLLIAHSGALMVLHVKWVIFWLFGQHANTMGYPFFKARH